MTTQGVIVLGLMFGDEGKGATVDFLTKELDASLVVKSSTACQAEHNVVTNDGRHHTFSQFGSGTFQGANTHIASNCFFEPLSFERELKALEELGAFGSEFKQGSVTVSPEALVTTPVHRSLNRAESEAGTTTGRGIWQTQVTEDEYPEYTVRVKDLLDWQAVADKLIGYAKQRDTIFETVFQGGTRGTLYPNQYEGFFESVAKSYKKIVEDHLVLAGDDVITDHDRVIFEQAQGVLLDAEMMSMYPYVTAKPTTSQATYDLVEDLHVGIGEVIACVRSYTTRHGAGILPTERFDSPPVEEQHNRAYKWAGGVRWGLFDAVLAGRALAYDQNITALSLGHLDADVQGARIGDRRNPVDGIIVDDIDTTDPITIERMLGRLVKVAGYGPRTCDRKVKVPVRI